MSRLLRSVVAVVVVALTSLADPRPVAAEPPTPPGQCTVEEWQNPTRWADCSGRLRGELGRRLDCIKPPTPASPTSGAAGMFASRPDADRHSGVKGRYTGYGVAGYGLDLYDMSCADVIASPAAAGQTAVADFEFTAAAALVGAANGLREHAYDPRGMYGWADGFVDDATKKIHEYVFSVFGVLVLAGTGVWLLWISQRGNLSQAAKVAAWALFVMVVVTGLARWPTQSAHLADEAAAGGLGTMHSVLGPSPHDIPPERCILPDPQACRDSRTVAVRASDTATEAILYRSWLRALLGSADSATARKYGPALFDASTLSWSEAENISAHPELRTVIVEQKQGRWVAIAEQIKVEDPEAYEHLQGRHGTDRMLAGLAAVFAAVLYVAFDITASLIIMFGFLVFRVAIVGAPLLGTIGLLQPWSAGFRRLGNAALSSLLNIVVFGGAAGLYLMAADLIFGADLAGWLQVLVVTLVGAALWRFLRPWRRFTEIGTGRRHVLTTRLRGRDESAPAPSKPAEQEPPATEKPAPPRPEAAPPPPRPAPATSTPRPDATPMPARPWVRPTAIAATAAAVTVAAAATRSTPGSGGSTGQIALPSGRRALP